MIEIIFNKGLVLHLEIGLNLKEGDMRTETNATIHLHHVIKEKIDNKMIEDINVIEVDQNQVESQVKNHITALLEVIMKLDVIQRDGQTTKVEITKGVGEETLGAIETTITEELSLQITNSDSLFH